MLLSFLYPLRCCNLFDASAADGSSLELFRSAPCVRWMLRGIIQIINHCQPTRLLRILLSTRTNLRRAKPRHRLEKPHRFCDRRMDPSLLVTRGKNGTSPQNLRKSPEGCICFGHEVFHDSGTIFAFLSGLFTLYTPALVTFRFRKLFSRCVCVSLMTMIIVDALVANLGSCLLWISTDG